MGLGKTYSADYLIDSNGNTGVSGQVLISTATGIDWADGTAITGGPFLPLSAGSSYPLTNSLYLENTSGSAGASPSLYFKNGSGNFWRYLHESGGDFSIKEGTATRLTFKAGGNVGIGTTDPQRPFHVNGGALNFVAEFQSTDDKASILIQDDDTLNYIHSQDGYLSLGGQNALNNGNLNIKSSDGNVGIGTTSPGERLHVYHATTNILGYLQSGDADATLAMADNGGSVRIQNTSGNLRFLTGGTASTSGSNTSEVMRVTSSNVGIGTTDPGAKLEVNVTDDTFNDINVLKLKRTWATASGSDRAHGISFNDANSNNATIYVDRTNSGANYNSDLLFATNTGTSGTSVSTKMVIKADGNVGIGTTDPTAKLNIGSAYNDAFVLTDQRTASNTSTFDSSIVWDAFYSDAAKITLTHNDYNTTYRRLHFDIGGNELMSIKANGNVGIGTTDPSYKLHVDGTVGITEYLYHSGDNNTYLRFSGDMVRLAAGGVEMIRLHEDATQDTLVINEGGADVDFRVESNTDTHALFVQGSDGNVGIGTASPDAELEISKAGSAVFMLTNTSAAQSWVQYVGSNDDFVLRDSTDGRTVFRVSGGGETYFESGNVGIGTTDPNYTLDVQKLTNENDDTIINIRSNWANTSADKKIGSIFFTARDVDVDSGATKTAGGIRVLAENEWTSSANSNAYMNFNTLSGGSFGERMRISSAGAIKFNAYGAGFLQTDANGNITAGTVTTSDTLDDVTDNGSSTTNSITVGGVTSTGGGEMQGGDLYFKNGGDDGAGTHLGNVWYSVSTGGGTAPVGVYESAVITTVQNGTHGRSDIVFKTKNNNTDDFGSANERMRITKEGLVGINKTAPHAYLHIDGSSYPQLLLDGGSNTTGDIVVPDGEILQIGHWNNGTTTFTGRLWLASSGHLGIGNNSPESLLHLGEAVNGANIISFGDASLGGPHGLDFYGDDATRTKKFSIYYRTGTENISMEDGSGTKRWEISQSGAVTFNQAFTFPTADGSTGAALVTNGSGSLSWNAGYQQYTPVGWGVSNNQTYTSTGANISSNSTQAQAGTTPVQRNSATEFEATKAGWYEISYSFIVKNNYNNRAMIGAYMGVSTSGGGGTISGSHSTQYVRYNTYGEYAQIQNTFYYYTSYSSTNFYLYASLLSGSMNMTTQSVSQSMISFRYINNDIT